LVGNKGYRKYLKSTGKARFEVDYDKVSTPVKKCSGWRLRSVAPDAVIIPRLVGGFK